MLNIKVNDKKTETTANGAKDDILAETVLAVISAARTFSEITHIPVEDAIDVMCAAARKNCGPDHLSGSVISFKIPRKEDK